MNCVKIELNFDERFELLFAAREGLLLSPCYKISDIEDDASIYVIDKRRLERVIELLEKSHKITLEIIE